MNYKSINDLSNDIKNNLHKIPKDVSLVVGIPRSGLLAANLLSLYLHVPLTDLDSFLKKQILSTGFRGRQTDSSPFDGKILIVDDSLCTGDSILEAKKRIENNSKFNKDQIIFCCVYVSPVNNDKTDISLVSLEMPRVFEWNIFHHKVLNDACMVVEGVLLKHKDIHVANDINLKSKTFTNPYILPKVYINTLISEKPERDRKLLEDWLIHFNIKYGNLIMIGNEGFTNLIINTDIAYKKAEIFKSNNKLNLFIEPNVEQAIIIFEKAQKHVYCLETNEMLTNHSFEEIVLKIKKRSYKIIKGFRSILKTF